MRTLDHHAALRAIGGSLSDITNKKTEYWTIPESKEAEFYDMRQVIPFENLLSGFRENGFIVYLDKPKMDNAKLLAAASYLLAALERVACCADTAAHLLRDIAPEESALFKADAIFARSAIEKAKG